MDRDRTWVLLWPPDRWPGDQNPDVSVSAERVSADNPRPRPLVRSDGVLSRSPDRQYLDRGPASDRNMTVSWRFVSYTLGYRNLARRMPWQHKHR